MEIIVVAADPTDFNSNLIFDRTIPLLLLHVWPLLDNFLFDDFWNGGATVACGAKDVTFFSKSSGDFNLDLYTGVQSRHLYCHQLELKAELRLVVAAAVGNKPGRITLNSAVFE